MRLSPKRITLRFLYLGFILTVGCTTFKPISLDVLIPPDTLVYPGLTSATIVYKNQLIGIKDSLFLEDPDSLVMDSAFRGKLLTECTLGLGEIIETSPGIEQVFIDSIEIPPYAFPGADQNQLLRKKFLKEVSSRTGSDIVILLEGINAWDTLVSFFTHDPSYSPEEGIQIFNLALVLAARWSVYETDSAKLLEQYLYVDTIIWSLEAYRVFYDEVNFPEPEDAFKEVFYWAGNGYGKRIVSTWEKVDRFYYCTNHNLMKQACKEVSNGNWREAAILWKDVYNQEKQKKSALAAKAAFNMAVACEREDKLDLARNWAINSYLLQKTKAAQDYVFSLNSRIFIGKNFDF